MDTARCTTPTGGKSSPDLNSLSDRLSERLSDEDQLSVIVPGSFQERPSFEAATVWESSKESCKSSDSGSSSEGSSEWQTREIQAVTLGEIPLPGQSRSPQPESPPWNKRRHDEFLSTDPEIVHSIDTISNHSATARSCRYSHASDASSTMTPSFGRFSRGSHDSPRTLRPFRWQNFGGESPRQCSRCRCGARLPSGGSDNVDQGSFKMSRTSLSMLERARTSGGERSPAVTRSPAPSERPSFDNKRGRSSFGERTSNASSEKTGTGRSASQSGRKSKRSGSESGEDAALMSNTDRNSDHLSDLSLTVSQTTVSQITAITTPGTAIAKPNHAETATQTETRVRTDIDTQTSASASVDSEVQTCIVWEHEGFKCKRCAKPPAMPSDSGSSISSPGVSRRPSRSRSRSPNMIASQLDGSTGGFPRPPTPSDLRSVTSKDSLNDESSDSESAVLGDLVETSLQGRAKSLSVTMKRWVLKPSTGCCPWHTAIDVAIDMALFLQEESRCKPQFAPLTGWQCRHCTVMCTNGANKCVVCGNKRDSKCLNSSHEAAAP